MKVVYPILLEYDGDDYLIHVPDFDLIEYGSEIYELLDGTAEDISLALLAKERLGKEIPEPADKLEVEPGQILLFLPVDTDEYTETIQEQEVYTEVVLPVELAELIQESELSIPELLEQALKNHQS